MIYTEMTKKAMKIAYEAHLGAVDKGGIPYIFHPFHLAEQMSTPEEVTVALLHDVIEDTDITKQDLFDHGFPQEVVAAVVAISKIPGEDYSEYLSRIKRNPVATAVKKADLIHNSDISRLDIVTKNDKERLEKYEKALTLLSE